MTVPASRRKTPASISPPKLAERMQCHDRQRMAAVLAFRLRLRAVPTARAVVNRVCYDSGWLVQGPRARVLRKRCKRAALNDGLWRARRGEFRNPPVSKPNILVSWVETRQSIRDFPRR